MSGKTLRIAAADARRLAIAAQRLVSPRPKRTSRGVLEVTRDIGHLQLDPTNVVARNPLLVLWSRLGAFNPAVLVTFMLAILQRRGEIVVAGRRRGHKLWAVADGWLPTTAPLAAAVLARDATTRALRALGVATLKQLRSHYSFGRHVSQAALHALERDGAVVRLEIADGNGAASGTRLETSRSGCARCARAGSGARRSFPPSTTSLSTAPAPSSSLRIATASRSTRPPHLRRLGFWAMPVLHVDRIVGSVDPRFERARGELVVNKVVLEPSAPRTATPAIRGAVEELADFVGAKKVVWL